MSSQYIPVPIGLGTEPISPPLSPPNECAIASAPCFRGMNDSNLSHEGSKVPAQDYSTAPKIEIGECNSNSNPHLTTKRPNRYRFKFCDIPAELLELIETSETQKNGRSSFSHLTAIIAAGNSPMSSCVIGNTKDINRISPTTSISADVLTASPNNDRVTLAPIQTQSETNIDNKGSMKKSGEKRHRIRKNPYPKRSPSKSSPGITLSVDIFTPLKENPRALLLGDGLSLPQDVSSPSLFSDDMFSSSESTSEGNSNSRLRTSTKKQRIKSKVKSKRVKGHISERKRKGNSLARVMEDRGLLEATFAPATTIGETKPIRIPPPPQMQFDKLMENIEILNLNTELLDRTTPKIHWKGQPLSILHSPHYNALHSNEAHVASTLRLTPIQYLMSKNTLVSSARRYIQKSLPFRKSDAQKLLRIDVNKASKLWEFFMQVEWIK